MTLTRASSEVAIRSAAKCATASPYRGGLAGVSPSSDRSHLETPAKPLTKIPRAVAVVDIETTGLDGAPEDLVVELGMSWVIFPLNGKNGVISSSGMILGYPEEEILPRRDSWVFRNTSLTVDEVISATPATDVMRMFREAVANHYLTSYNAEFDLDRFLLRSPWNLDNEIVRAPCIMEAARDAFPDLAAKSSVGFPRLAAVYGRLCPEDPCKVNGGQPHRAKTDSKMAAHVMLRLHELGFWKFPGDRGDSQCL